MAMSMRTTREIAERFSLELVGAADVEVSGVSLNTFHLESGALFIAASGARSHGLDYLEIAIDQGAVAVLTDQKEPLGIPSLFHPNPREIAGEVADFVYETGDSNMLLYGVTGTNGKTSTVFYLRELLSALGQSAGMISSAFSRVGTATIPADLTTPEAPRIHQFLSQMRLEHQFSAAIEASAQGISRARLKALHFRIAGFTNLSRDHLDDFQNMDSYLAAKAQLFTPEYADKAVVFIEDDWAQRLFDQISIPKVSIGGDYHFSYQDGQLEISGRQSLSAQVSLSNLMAKNLALALVMLLEDRYTPEKLVRALDSINLEVPGRLQRVSDAKPAVFIDYAHTPAAVAASARELAETFPSLTIVLAASGDRDSGKRAEMAKAAAEYANHIVITDQHPRSEDPAVIRQQLIAGLEGYDQYTEVDDPERAIKEAISLTEKSGAVLWCGPGHLKYREIKGEKISFDALALAREALDHD